MTAYSSRQTVKAGQPSTPEESESKNGGPASAHAQEALAGRVGPTHQAGLGQLGQQG